MVSLAYPVADLLLLSMIVAVLALTEARLDRMLVTLILAIAATCVADVAFFYGTAIGTWKESSPLSLLWPLGGALFAVAAWTRHDEVQRTPVAGMRSLALPSIFAVAVIGYMLTDPARVAEVIGGLGLLVLVVRITVGARENQQLTDRLGLDPLTGLGNRGSLSAELSRAIDSGEPHTLVFADLDGFKLYNDAFGHPAGDALLKRLSSALSQAVPSASAYRMGGDEFCILIPGEVSEADHRSKAIVAALSERGEGFSVGVSLGYASVPSESVNPEELVQLADQRMYATKEDRRHAHQTQDAFAVLVNAQREREPSLSDHVDGVAELASQVGKRMGLLPGEVSMLERAAELHDIGKMGIPEAILDKPGPLNEEELEFMRQHTVLGERILLAADSLAPVARIVRSCHERLDGRGYPDGLEGDQIPLASRIIFACDAFHAMTSERPYCTPKSREEALAELERCAGSQFDPEVVNVLCRLLGREADQPAAATHAGHGLLAAASA
jgi:diguanylate cyclase (GGDEF)-like protein